MFTASFFWSQVAKQISYGRFNDLMILIKVLLKDKCINQANSLHSNFMQNLPKYRLPLSHKNDILC